MHTRDYKYTITLLGVMLLSGQAQAGVTCGVVPCIDSDDLINKAVTTPKIAPGAVTSAKIAPGAVTSAKIVPGAVLTEKIKAGAVSSAKLAPAAVTSSKIAIDAVVTKKIKDGAVTRAKLAADARAFTVESFANTHTAPDNSTCTNHPAGNITITAPGPGSVLVSNQTWSRVVHTNGVEDGLRTVLSSTAGADCGTWQWATMRTIPAAMPTFNEVAENANNSMLAKRSFVVPSAGTYTFYLNVYGSGGTGHDFWWSGTTATFIPE